MRNQEFKGIAQVEREESYLRKKNSEVIELLRNTLIMLIITVVAGGLLGFFYSITKEPIANMHQKTIDEANKRVFVDAVSFSESILDTASMEALLADNYSGVDITEAVYALDAEGNVLGVVLEVTSHEGFGGDIVFRIGIQNNQTINAISLTSISETAGLGMNAEKVIVPQFSVVRADEFVVTKNGKLNDNEIDAISSATITSKAIVKGVNAAIVYFKSLGLGGVE